MTVEGFADPVTYAYTGAGDFTFSFRVFDAADLLVVHRSTTGVTTELVKDTDYTVTVEESSPYGGTVHCTYAATTGYLVIRRELAFTQETDWVNNDSLDAEILERAFDRLTMLLQQIQVDVDEGGALTNWRGEWATGTDYVVQDLVTTDTGVYVCTEEHTSAAAFSTDLSAGRWIIVLDPSLLTTPGLPFIDSGDALKFVRVKSDESEYELTDDVEPSLGSPSADGMALISTAAGVRSWRAQFPVGAIIAWTTGTAPTGTLECNGAAISRTTYAALYAVLGTTFGVGDGSTTFNLPDLRGEFLRGWAHGSSNDPDRASRTNRGDGTTGDYVGTKQAHQFYSHTHNAYITGDSGTDDREPSTASSGNISLGSASSAGGNETRPRNVNVMYCIVYQ